ncbi:MAG: Ig-like domain-containing protein [Gemmatimonadaceae bacterium]|nr:Ig-like domain-containing protein [Gemmatimonadaceae bacterium]
MDSFEASSSMMGGVCDAPGYLIPLGAMDTLYHSLSGLVVTYSSDPSIASVPSSGYPVYVTSHALGEACITATSSSGFAQVKVTVVAPAVTTVTVSPAATSVAIGSTTQLAATAFEQQNNPMTGVSFSWSSSSSSIATVNSAGLVTGVGTGQTIVEATANGKSGTATVSVPAPSVSISGPQYIARYQSAQYTATPFGGQTPYTYQWRSRDGNAYSWGSWSSWYSTGSTSYTFASISACGLDRKQIEVKATDSQPVVSNVGSFTLYLTNPC